MNNKNHSGIIHKVLGFIIGENIEKKGIKKTIKDIFISNFKPVRINDTFLLGVYNESTSPTWRRMVRGEFELPETYVIKKFLPFFDNFIDIGAHIGYFSCLVGYSKSSTNIIAFEPSPINFKSLKKNLEINQIDKVRIFNIGLSDNSLGAVLFGEDAAGTMNTESFKIRPERHIKIETDTLDHYTEFVDKNKNSFIKIDVEAFEYTVFKGGRNFLETIKPIGIMAEIIRQTSGGENINFAETFNLLHSMGYDSYIIDDKIPLNKTGDISSLIGGNYLFVRRNMTDYISKQTRII